MLEPSFNNGRKALRGHATSNAIVLEMDDGTLFTIGKWSKEGLPIAHSTPTLFTSFSTGNLGSRFPDILNPAAGGVKFKKVFANVSSFAVLRNDNSVVVWGSADSGGAPLANGLVTSEGIARVYLGLGDSAGNGTNQVADPLDPATNGGLPIVDIFGGGTCYLALRGNGSIVTWGAVVGCGDATGVSTDTESVKLIDSNRNGVADLLEKI